MRRSCRSCTGDDSRRRVTIRPVACAAGPPKKFASAGSWTEHNRYEIIRKARPNSVAWENVGGLTSNVLALERVSGWARYAARIAQFTGAPARGYTQ